jgi:flavin reductase (DIM6/NTAB) family NADH-FMN oxidoreductase RutF
MIRCVSSAIDEVVSRLDYPVFVVTTADPTTDERAGCLVGFLTQCSMDPVRFLVCLSVRNHTYRVARRAELLAVHLIGDDQRELAELFGSTTGDEVDKFRRCAWHPGPGGVPLLDGASAWFVGTVLERTDLGDHVGFLVSPTASHVTDDQPAVMFSAVRDLTPGHFA